jgi:hypothetical protein
MGIATRSLFFLSILIFAAMLLPGCGGMSQDRFSYGARPIGKLLEKAIEESNTSHLASLLTQAIEMERARMITPWDLKTIQLIESAAKGNEWKEAKKMLEAAMRE